MVPIGWHELVACPLTVAVILDYLIRLCISTGLDPKVDTATAELLKYNMGLWAFLKSNIETWTFLKFNMWDMKIS